MEAPADSAPIEDDTLGELFGDQVDTEELQMDDVVTDDGSMWVSNARAVVGADENLANAVAAFVNQGLALVRPFCGPAMSGDDYYSLIRSAAATSVEWGHGTSGFLGQFTQLDTRVEKFEDCFRPVKWSEACDMTISLAAVPDFPNIASVSAAFKPNNWQRHAFETMARHLLYAPLQDCATSCEDLARLQRRSPWAIKRQLRCYLSGDAGTDKSTVIHAVLMFARKWGRGDAVETLAFTGFNAMGIDWSTIHSARNLS
jgi:hypothetical protein